MESGKKVGSYVIEEPVGRGGMGVVYRGRHEKLPRVVAIKSINPRGSHDLRRLRHRFEREAYVQAQLDHPGVVKIYDYIVSEQTYFIVMEYVEGRSLGQLIAEHAGGLGAERALDLFEQILEAVSYAHTFVYRDEGGTTHTGIVHRDLKPPNIMVTDGDRIKVTDFGIVKLVGAEATDTSKIAYGSPRYVSPEQAAGEHLDQRSDIYSLGVILYEMLTGEPPFGGRAGSKDAWSRTEILRAHRERQPRPPSELSPDVPASVEHVVMRALEKKPERRFNTAEDFLRAVRKARGRVHTSLSPEHAGAAPAAAPKGTGVLGEATGEMSGDPYHTQPIAAEASEDSEVCRVCGSGVGEGETVCGVCGHDLTASPATAELARQEATTRAGGQGLRLFAVSVALLGLLAALVYLVGSFAPAGTREEPTPTPTPTPAARAEPTPHAGAVVALKPVVRVDSSYDSYNARPLTDGVTDVREIAAKRYNLGNWVSAESPPQNRPFVMWVREVQAFGARD
ncbi:MAG: serine/threonine protein kinase [Acidobacteria bacterium]|nr:serine/threonine protein kinase [Acidobacteriota bacterium]